MAIPGGKGRHGDAFFINKAIPIPANHVQVALISAVTTSERKEAMADLLAKGNGGGNCVMDLKDTSYDLTQTLTNRQKAFDTEFGYTAKEKKERINLKGAQFM